ncbi:MAG: right-handed parallel beta-helix repeat-containing protein [Phycisphaerales bacterium]
MSAPNTKTLARVALALLAVGGVISTLVWAGPLNPPGGAVSSTYKTLTEVEPRIAINSTNTPGDTDSLYKITQRGSYYLTGNIVGVAGKHGIEIVASGVTLDLNGFELAGFASMGAFDGVSATTYGLVNITVVNGSVRNWGQNGINLGLTGVVGCRIEGVSASGNTNIGIWAGARAEVSRCIADDSAYGIYTGANSTVQHCIATYNSSAGITLGNGSSISDSSAGYNTEGINLSYGSTAANCATYTNSGNGFVANSGCAISDCVARYNALDGVNCGTACTITGNTCTLNGTGDGAGIHATGSDNRIEANNCTSADRGIDVDGAGNIIIKNTCSGNTTNWEMVANNIYGPIIDRSGAATAAVSGSSAASTLSSTDPNANFTY